MNYSNAARSSGGEAYNTSNAASPPMPWYKALGAALLIALASKSSAAPSPQYNGAKGKTISAERIRLIYNDFAGITFQDSGAQEKKAEQEPATLEEYLLKNPEKKADYEKQVSKAEEKMRFAKDASKPLPDRIDALVKAQNEYIIAQSIAPYKQHENQIDREIPSLIVKYGIEYLASSPNPENRDETIRRIKRFGSSEMLTEEQKEILRKIPEAASELADLLKQEKPATLEEYLKNNPAKKTEYETFVNLAEGYRKGWADKTRTLADRADSLYTAWGAYKKADEIAPYNQFDTLIKKELPALIVTDYVELIKAQHTPENRSIFIKRIKDCLVPCPDSITEAQKEILRKIPEASTELADYLKTAPATTPPAVPPATPPSTPPATTPTPPATPPIATPAPTPPSAPPATPPTPPATQPVATPAPTPPSAQPTPPATPPAAAPTPPQHPPTTQPPADQQPPKPANPPFQPAEYSIKAADYGIVASNKSHQTRNDVLSIDTPYLDLLGQWHSETNRVPEDNDRITRRGIGGHANAKLWIVEAGLTYSLDKRTRTSHEHNVTTSPPGASPSYTITEYTKAVETNETTFAALNALLKIDNLFIHGTGYGSIEDLTADTQVDIKVDSSDPLGDYSDTIRNQVTAKTTRMGGQGGLWGEWDTVLAGILAGMERTEIDIEDEAYDVYKGLVYGGFHGENYSFGVSGGAGINLVDNAEKHRKFDSPFGYANAAVHLGELEGQDITVFGSLWRLDNPAGGAGLVVGRGPAVKMIMDYYNARAWEQLDLLKHFGPDERKAYVTKMMNDFMWGIASDHNLRLMIFGGARRTDAFDEVERKGVHEWKFMGEAALSIPLVKGEFTLVPYARADTAGKTTTVEGGLGAILPNGLRPYIGGGMEHTDGAKDEDAPYFSAGIDIPLVKKAK